MKPTIPTIYNGDSYLFYVEDDWSVVRVERFANNQNVAPEEVPLDKIDPELQRQFEKQLQHYRKAGWPPIS